MSILKYKLRNINQIGGSDKVIFKFINSRNELNEQEIKEITDSNKKCFGNETISTSGPSGGANGDIHYKY